MTYIADGHSAGARSSDRFAEIRMPGLGIEPLLMVEEITHRVVNQYAGAIAAINFEATRTADADARAALRRTTDKLHAFAEAHRALQAPACWRHVPGRLPRPFCAALSEASLRERGVYLILVDDVVMLAARRCWRVALIIAEDFITNSVQHHFKEFRRDGRYRGPTGQR